MTNDDRIRRARRIFAVGSLLAALSVGAVAAFPHASDAAMARTRSARGAVATLAQFFDQHHHAYKESGGCSIFSTRVGRSCEPWCADFVQYIWSAVGIVHPDSGWVPNWQKWAMARHLWHPVTEGTFSAPGYRPHLGDLMVYGIAHIGIVVGGGIAGPTSTNGNFPDGVYTMPHLLTDTGRSDDAHLTGYIEMPTPVVVPTTTALSTSTTTTTVVVTTTTQP